MAKKLIKKLNEREIYAKVADYAIKDENGDKISDRKVKSVSVSGRTMTVTNTGGELEVPVVPVPTEVGLVLKSGEDGEYGWGHEEAPGDGRLKVKIGSADAVDTGFNADVHSDVVMEIPVAAGSADGLMSATDKTEFDRISAGFDDKASKTELLEEVTRVERDISSLAAEKQDVIGDLDMIRSGASAGATAYQKPAGGIPKADLADDVQASLVKADTALQEHQDISGKADVATTLAGYGITDATIVKSNGSATVTLGNESLLFGTTTFQTMIDDIVIDDNSPLVSDPDVTLVSHVSGTELLARRAFEDEYGHNIHDTYATKTECSEEVTRIDGELSALNTEKQDVIDDLPDIRSGAAAGATAYQRPENGIPKSDLASEVQTSLGKADTALQEHQDISGKAEKAEMAIADVSGDATKKNIQLKTGLSQDVLVVHQGITAGDGINVSRVDNVLTIAHQVVVVSLTAELVSGTDTDYAVTVPLNKYTMITVPQGAGTLTVNVPAAPEGVLQEAAFQFDVGAGEDFDFDVKTGNTRLKRIAPLSLTAGNSYQGTVIGGLCTLGEFEEVQ